ncbi:hypothetical protein [Promicromonospora xylanilytica]
MSSHGRHQEGEELFNTTAGGVVEHPESGEAVWCDETGGTCRRWNGRQRRLITLTDPTTSAVFILDVVTGHARSRPPPWMWAGAAMLAVQLSSALAIGQRHLRR